MSLRERLHDFKRAFYLKQFGPKERTKFYETSAILLENGVQLKDVLKEQYDIYSDDGQRPGHPTALACEVILKGVANGRKLSEAMADLVPVNEQAIITAGEQSNLLPQSLMDCKRQIEVRQQIKGLIVQATAYPAVLMVLMVYLLYTIANKLIPAMLQGTSSEILTGAAWLLYWISNIVTHYGLVMLVIAVTLIATIMFSLPYHTGSLRVYLDRLPPWSIYRILHGCTFLMNMSMMIKSGYRPYEALEMLMGSAKPWLHERLSATRYGLAQGYNLGQALKNSGLEFPDNESVRYLTALANLSGFAHAMERFSDRWLEISMQQVSKASRVILISSILMIGSLMGLVQMGTMEIQSIFEFQAQNF